MDAGSVPGGGGIGCSDNHHIHGRIQVLPDYGCGMGPISQKRMERNGMSEDAEIPGEFHGVGRHRPQCEVPLILCSKSVNSQEYLSIIARSGIVQLCDARHGQWQWFMKQDGAPAHQARATMEALSSLTRILPGWPANRCDLNPIEMIWSIMGEFGGPRMDLRRGY